MSVDRVATKVLLRLLHAAAAEITLGGFATAHTELTAGRRNLRLHINDYYKLTDPMREKNQAIPLSRMTFWVQVIASDHDANITGRHAADLCS